MAEHEGLEQVIDSQVVLERVNLEKIVHIQIEAHLRRESGEVVHVDHEGKSMILVVEEEALPTAIPDNSLHGVTCHVVSESQEALVRMLFLLLDQLGKSYGLRFMQALWTTYMHHVSGKAKGQQQQESDPLSSSFGRQRQSKRRQRTQD